MQTTGTENQYISNSFLDIKILFIVLHNFP